MTKSIQQLTPGVVKKLRSGIAFMSVAHCVEELVLNSIDAEANCIAVNLNLPVYQIQVIDNGCGISAEQMHLVGTRYATSKCHTLEDLQHLKSGGFRGEALSSLKEISSVLMIESRTTSSADTYCKIFTQGKALDPKKSLNSRPSKGTTVTVYDFMYNLPVRKKSICEALDLEECRKLLQSIALMYPNISFTLQNEATGEMCLQLRKCSSLYHSFLQMFGKSKASSLKTVDYQVSDYEVNGCISMDCYLSKDLQFLYVNKRRVLRTKLHKLINRILNKALYSKQNSNINSGSSTSETSSPSKNQRYCIFVINISCPYDKYDIIFEPRKTMIEFSDWDSVLKITNEALIDFLKRENLFSDVTELELNEPNSKTQEDTVPFTFDVQDVQHGLFSHVARRLKFVKPNNHSSRNIMPPNTEKSTLCGISETEVTSKFHPGNESTPSNESKSCDFRENVESSDQPISSNLKSDKSSISLPCNLSSNIDKNTPKGADETVSSPLPETDFDIPCRSVFPSQNPIMLRVPSKSALSNLQTSSSNLKFLQMEEKIKHFVKNGNPISLNKNKQSDVPLHSAEISINKSAQNSPALCIDENKLKDMIDKSSQCPSVSHVNQNNKKDQCIVKKTEDKSFQCPSVKNNARITSRFEFKEETHALFQNLKKSKRSQKNTSRRLQAESTPIFNNSFSSLIDHHNDNYKSKKFKSSHFTESFEIGEKSVPEDINISVETELNYEINRGKCSSFYIPDDVISVPESPRKIHKPDMYCKKVVDFNKFRSSFDLQTFPKVQKTHPADNISIFNEFGKKFHIQNEKLACQSEENSIHCTSENIVNSHLDLFPDIITDNTIHNSKTLERSFCLEDSYLSSNLKENTKHVLTKKMPMAYEKLDDNVSDFSFSELSPSSSDVFNVVRSLVSNVAEVNYLPHISNAIFYEDEIKEVHPNIPKHSNIHDEVFTNSNMPSNKAVETHLNGNRDEFSNFKTKSVFDNDLKNNAFRKFPSACLEKSTIVDPENFDQSSVLTPCNNNYETNSFTQKLLMPSDNSATIFNNKLNSNSVNETSFLLKEGLGNNFDSVCFTEKLSPTSDNDIAKSYDILLNNSHQVSDVNAAVLEKKSDDDIEMDSNPFIEKLPAVSDINAAVFLEKKSDDIEMDSNPFTENLPAVPDENSVRFHCNKLNNSNNSDTGVTHTTNMGLPDYSEFESVPFTEKIPLISHDSSPVHSEIKSYRTLLDENSGTPSDLRMKSTAEIEFDSETLNQEFSKNSGNPLLKNNYSDENNINSSVQNISSQELFKVSIPVELQKLPDVSDCEQHVSETSAVLSNFKEKNYIETCSNECEVNNLEAAGKTSTENEFSSYNDLKLHSQPECKRKIFIDSVTGNSSYIVPEKSEVSENKVMNINNGFPKKSHFFLSHDYSPFVSKTQTPVKFMNDNSNIQNDLMNYVKNHEKSEYCDKWRSCKEVLNSCENIENMLIAWDNPAFDIPYEVSSIGDDKIMPSVSQMHIFFNSYRFSKDTLNSLQVIGQVDCKFIACILKDFNKNCKDQKLLALFDQHAVHERIRLEELIEDLYEVDANYEKYVKTSSVNPPLEISLSDEEIRLLQVYHEKLHKIGIHLNIENQSQILNVLSVPSCLVHKETGELRRSISDTVTILQNSITEWLSSVVKTRSIPQVLPKTLSSVLNYQACRSAVKFGDPLNLEQCCDLMKSLSSCKLPFQCAHGRPSVAPILDLKKVETLYKKRPAPKLQVISRSLGNS